MTSKPDGDGGKPEAAAMDEVALMAGVAAERMDAFETLYRLYHPRLARFLQRMTGRPTLAEEALDDTMLVVWRRAHTYDPTARVSTWIFGIAYRQALRALRAVDGAARSRGGDDEEAPPSDAGTADADDPGQAMQQRQQRLLLDQALAVLSPEHRAVIEMTYFLGYSCREIAQVMDCPVATVKTRMFHARRRLRTRLGTRGEEAL